MFNKFLLSLVFSLALTSAALAAGDSDSSISASNGSAYDKAEKMVKKGDYKRALLLMQEIVAKNPNNANAWNYIGFSYRKLGRLDVAVRSYKKALAIDPGHKGANEYLGELYVETGRMKLARKHLAKLGTLCTFGCEEYDDLKATIHAAGG